MIAEGGTGKGEGEPSEKAKEEEKKEENDDDEEEIPDMVAEDAKEGIFGKTDAAAERNC